MTDPSLYKGREQTWVKHFILREYLQRFAHIIGSRFSSITYVDCFSGPWQQKSEKYEDTSFFIALDELRKARETHRQRSQRGIRLRAFFIEKDPASFQQLKKFAASIDDIEVETRNDELEKCISDIVTFIKGAGNSNFPFIFIDPTGWTGFGMKAIEPLLKLNPGEVLINFMTGHIRRLIDHPDEELKVSFDALYGTPAIRDAARGKTGLEREDALISPYMRELKSTGGYQHVSAAVVLNPTMDRTHFHLIYGTRNPLGLEVFKGAEKKAMEAMEKTREEIREQKRQAQSGGQFELFSPKEVTIEHSYFEELRHHYLSKAKATVAAMLQKQGRVAYDRAYSVALMVPLTFEADLKRFIEDWQKEGKVRLEGLKIKERVPKVGANHFLVWTGPTQATP